MADQGQDRIQKQPEGEDRLHTERAEHPGTWSDSETGPEGVRLPPPEEFVRTSPTEEELTAFIGFNADYYLSRWLPALERGESPAGFNWAAFLFPQLWLPYRQLYPLTVALYGVFLVEALLQIGCSVFLHVSDETLAVLNLIVSVPVCLVVGYWGNSWYLRRARRTIAEVRTYELPSDEHFEELAYRGGTNLLSAFGILAIFLAILYVINGALGRL